jgi:hypothetical protein
MLASDGWSAMHAPLASLASNANTKVEEAKKISDFEYIFDYSPLNINCQNIDWALPTRCCRSDLSKADMEWTTSTEISAARPPTFLVIHIAREPFDVSPRIQPDSIVHKNSAKSF